MQLCLKSPLYSDFMKYTRALTFENVWQEGDTDAARQLLERAIEWSPDYYRALADLGVLLARAGGGHEEPEGGRQLAHAELLLSKVLHSKKLFYIVSFM